MATQYVSFAGWQAVAAWTASASVAVGALVRQAATPTVYNERVFRCITAGTTGSTEPSWNLNQGGTTTDNTVTWQEVTGQEAYQAPGAWAAPHASVRAAGLWAANGDRIYVASGHARTFAAANTWLGSFGQPPKSIFSIDESATGHVPPLSTDLKPGAFEGTSGNNSQGINDTFREINGFTLQSGSGANSPDLNLSNNNQATTSFKNCNFVLGGTNGGSIYLGFANGTKITAENCAVKFASTASRLRCPTEVYWRDTPSILISGSAIPAFLLSYNNGSAAGATFENVDFSSYTSGQLIDNTQIGGVYFRFLNCKLPPNVPIMSSPSLGNVVAVEVSNSDSGTSLGRHERYTFTGTQLYETGIVRTGGASVGQTLNSWKVTPNSLAVYDAFSTMPVLAWNALAGSAVTATVEGIWNSSALPTQDDISIDVRYPGSATTTIGARASNAKANTLAAASNLPASSAAWDSNLPARSNSTAYTAGTAIKVASNPGRVFFCTVAGTSASSEPGGYASAVDGGTVTDGSATFRAGVRFKLQATFTQAIAGVVAATIRSPRSASTFYIDPLLTVA